MTQTLTTEVLRDIVANAKTSLEQYLALELLAKLEEKPIGYVSASTLNCLKSMQTHEIITAKPEKDAVNERDWDVIPVYTAPPAPAVPDDLIMQVRRLVHALKKSNPDHALVKQVPDYMRRAGYWKMADCLRDGDSCRAAMLVQPVSQGCKLPPHAYRELVNSLRDTAVKYSGTDQLRERLNTTLSQFIEPDHPHTRTAAPDSV